MSFYRTAIGCAVVFLMIGVTALAQTGFPKYYEFIALTQKGDSLYQSKDYLRAAQNYRAATKIEVERGIDISKVEAYYNAACSFSLAKKPADAFECLETLAVAYEYREYERVIADSDFVPVHADKRWLPAVNKIAANKNNYERKQALITLRTTLPPEVHDVIFYPLTPMMKKFVENDTLCFVAVHHQNFRIYLSGDSYAARHLEEVKSALSDAYQRAISLLDEGEYKRGINVVLFNSAEEMQQITGVRAQGGIAYSDHDFAFFPYHTKRRPQFRHELFHLIANRMWGYTYSRLLNEGSAVYADNRCYSDNAIYGANALLLKNKKLFPLRSLVEEFDARAIESDVIAYLQSAGVVKYLIEKYGVARFKVLWKEGFTHFKDVYGQSIQDLEAEWLHYIGTIPIPADIDQAKLLSEGCG